MSSNGASVVDAALRIAEENPGDLLAFVGPTASGKTALAIEVAERIGGEIIGADSVQVYRAFDIGSGKPSADEMRRVRHYLVGVLEPMDPSVASAWAERAAQAVGEIRARGRTPIVCGGSFLWVKALVRGLAPMPGASAEIRAHHRDLVDRAGRGALHDRLRGLDPAIATRLHPNDVVRVSRALEVLELTGRPMSAWQREHGFAETRFPTQLVAIACTSETLTARISARAAHWLATGWIDEVEALLARGFGGARAMSSVGYAQVRSMLAGDLAREDLLPAIVRATRVFARRQRTWLNRERVTWLGLG
ncbi:MAG: tRNA (adenosine(37)-N6)-dimethylallyltransferase MiaA [Polyangiaceae bacterium]|nr:tRNA (adenosine(37)-N6)-dimethylallyltransferase MiaA [Polyangiaceae bacterium]